MPRVLTDFLFTQHGRRLGYTRLRNGLLAAAEAAGLRAPDGGVLTVRPHQLRHTWATELANAPALVVADPTKIHADLGWLTHDLDSIIQSAWQAWPGA